MSMKSKGNLVLDESKTCSSAFTLTFVIEVVDTNVWHDCNAGWLDLGPAVQGVKLSYQLYPGQTFDVDVVIWPHVAKVFCGTDYGWVRTWQFLERRWLTFSIRHAFPVRVKDLRNFKVTLTPSFGLGALSANSKTMNAAKVFLPPLQFGERRQFAKVVEVECPLKKYIEDMIWFLVVNYIPTSILDGPFETPYPVQDVRHQDAALYEVRNAILNSQEKEKEEKENIEVVSYGQLKGKVASKENVKKLTTYIEKVNYEIKLPGDWILAGIGRVTPFVITGHHPSGQGKVMALISSINLPAVDDFSIFFVNVCNLTDVPIEHLQRNRLTHIYTRWTISEEHNSEQQSLQTKEHKTEINFNDHHSVPLSNAEVSDVMATFYDETFQLELRGIRIPPPVMANPTFFGYGKTDRNYDARVPPSNPKQDEDILIAQTRIDARALTKINGSIKGEFPLYPPETSVMSLEREGICTNDINAVRANVTPDLIIQPGIILQAQMTIEVSLGLVVGCKPKSDAVRYSRLYCLVSDRDAIMTLLREITEINESVMQTESKVSLLTGFGLDTGDTVMLYVEGPRDGRILRFWEKTEDFYPTVKPIFSTSARYTCRLYPDLLLATMPFNIMKMVVPLSVLLGLPSIYARPALPLPTRSALLKIGRLIASKLESAPCRRAMPTAMELQSFRLELCAPPRPSFVFDQLSHHSSIYSDQNEQK